MYDLGPHCHRHRQSRARWLLPTWTPPLDRPVQWRSCQLPGCLLNIQIWSSHTFSTSGLRKFGFHERGEQRQVWGHRSYWRLKVIMHRQQCHATWYQSVVRCRAGSSTVSQSTSRLVAWAGSTIEIIKKLNQSEANTVIDDRPMRSWSCWWGLWRILKWVTALSKSSDVSAISAQWRLPFRVGTPLTTI